MKTSELTDITLDWAVTTIEQPEALRFGLEDWCEQRRTNTRFGEYLYRWSTSWTWAGSIIERERIDIWWDGDWVAAMCRPGTTAADWDRAEEHGPTPLVAAMRAFVAAYHGDDGTVPDELTK